MQLNGPKTRQDRRTGRKDIMYYTCALLVVCLLGFGATAHSCDDTLLALLTANDPNSEFSTGIRDFNRSLALLGTALNARRSAELPADLEKVMESWLAFSNRFNVNPPEVAREDVAWPAKMQEAAERIGNIRKLVAEQNYGDAHDAVLALSGRLGMFFEAVGMTPIKRRFLAGSELLARLEQDRVANRFAGMKTTCASITGWLNGFRSTLASDALPPFDRTARAVSQLSLTLDVPTASQPFEIEWLVKHIEANITDLRARVLMREWFPPAPSAGIKATGTGGLK